MKQWVYPWQRDSWERMRKTHAAMGHAWLLSAPAGCGLWDFARAVVNLRLCQAEDAPCGQCADCRQLARTGEHPDFLCIEPEESASRIKVEQIRKLIDFMQVTPFMPNGSRVCLVRRADTMGHHAVHALLKILEEPPGSACIILTCRNPGRLPATIRSRCQWVPVRAQTDARTLPETLEWMRPRCGDEDPAALLEAAGHAPLRAVEWAEQDGYQQRRRQLEQLLALLDLDADPLDCANEWQAADGNGKIEWLLELSAALLRRKLCGVALPDWFGESRSGLQKLLDRIDSAKLYECHLRTLAAWRKAHNTANFNRLGLLEDLLLFWRQRLHPKFVL